jgi:hypothetical protein
MQVSVDLKFDYLKYTQGSSVPDSNRSFSAGM